MEIAYLRARIIKLMLDFFGDDFRRIEYAFSVLQEAQTILKSKDIYDKDIVIACALLHYIRIKQSEEELGYNNRKTQEQFRPVTAGVFWEKLDSP